MGYVTHRQGLYRTGFRPVATNPYAATQLGLTPFEPEILREHGLGQTHPFTPGGGYGLHGLGDIVPNGSIVTYTGQWITDISSTPDGILAEVVAAVNKDGLHVVSSSQSGGLLGLVFTGHFTATLQIQVNNGMGFGNPNDIAAIIDHEFYAATGEMPQGSSASVTALPGEAGSASLPGPATNWQQIAMLIGAGLIGIAVIERL
jgi:hypothetical protein